MKKLILLFLSFIFMISLASCEFVPGESLIDDNPELTEAYEALKDQFDFDNITESIDLPNKIGDVKIFYESSNEDVLSNEGVVNRQEKNVIIVLDVTFVLDGESLEKHLYVTIVGTGKVNPPAPTNKLAEAFEKLTNYKCSFNYIGDYVEDDEYDSNTTVEYSIEGDKAAWVIDDVEYYTYVKNNVTYGIYQDGSSYYLCDEESDEFYNYIYNDYPSWYFGEIDDDDFELVDGWYVCKEESLQSVGIDIIGDFTSSDEYGDYTNTFKTIKIKLNNDNVERVIVECLFVEDYGTYGVFNCNCTYDITITAYSAKVTLPEVSEKQESSGIKEFLELDDDEEATFTAYVYGKAGNYIFVGDGEHSTVVFIPKKSSVNYSDLECGDYIRVSGTKDTYKGLIELTDITELTVLEAKKINPEFEDVSSFAEIDEDCQGLVINLQNVSVASASSSSKSGDLRIDISDGSITYNLFIRSSLVSTYSSQITNLSIGDKIDVTNVGISWYNGVQFMVLENSEISESNFTGLKSNVKSVKVENGVSLDAAMESFTFQYYVNNVPTTLSLYDVTYTCASYDENKGGTFSVNVSYLSYSLTVTIVVSEPPIDEFVDEDAEDLTAVTKKYKLDTGMPTTGDVNVLVFPISFTNKTVPTNCLENLNIAFNGTSEQTGWESLKSYYYKSSYGKLNITATICDIYATGEKYDKNKSDSSNADVGYIEDCLAYYNSKIDYTDYDADNDGYIDCIYIVYLAEYNADSDDSIWWAFTNNYYQSKSYDNEKAQRYIFMSYYFLEDPIMYADFDEEDSINKDLYLTINAETIIHETGHALGVNDYYDYDDSVGPSGGIGGSDMMDYNVGDHNAFSKAILGWINPTIVINKDTTLVLNPYESSGDAVIIAKDWNGSYFTEYYIIDYYTVSGLYELCQGYKGVFTTNGVRIYHVNGQLEQSNFSDGIWYIYKYDNTETKIKLISLVEADGKNDIEDTSRYETGELSSNSDLFQVGDTWSPKWSDGTSCDFTLTVVSMEDGSVTITIDFK